MPLAEAWKGVSARGGQDGSCMWTAGAGSGRGACVRTCVGVLDAVWWVGEGAVGVGFGAGEGGGVQGLPDGGEAVDVAGGC